MNYIEKISDFDFQISGELDDKITVTSFSFQRAKSKPGDSLPSSLKAFYEQVNNLTYEWITKEPVTAGGQNLRGRIKILNAAQVVGDHWKGVIYFSSDDDEREHLKEFKPVDFFVDEACCGFYHKEGSEGTIFYHDCGESETESLGVDFNGYLELMFMARGFWYWQRAVLHIKNGTPYVEAENFKTYMPQIFSDFKWEEFVALYERVKIK